MQCKTNDALTAADGPPGSILRSPVEMLSIRWHASGWQTESVHLFGDETVYRLGSARFFPVERAWWRLLHIEESVVDHKAML